MSSPDMFEGVDFRRVFETSRDVYALVAPDPPDFTLIDVSDGFTRLTMRSREELLGRKIFDLFPENPNGPEAGTGPEAARASFERVLREKRTDGIGTLRYDVPDPRSPGHFEERYFSPINEPVLDENGDILFILHRPEEVTDFILRERLRPKDYPAELPSGKRLVVVEGEPDQRTYLKELFATHWQVAAVTTAQEALAEIAQHTPDLVIAAMDLPDRKGDKMVRTLRNQGATADLPVILMLPAIDPDRFRQAFQAGASEVVSGRVSAGELIARAEARVAANELRRILPERTRETFHQLFMQAPISITLLEGPDHIITLSNPAHDRLVGNRQMVGLTVKEAFTEPGMEPFFQRLDRVYETGDPLYADEVPVDFQPPGRDEPSRVYLTQSYLPIRDLDGEIMGVAAFEYDVTEQVKARQALEQEAERKDELLSLLGHELRNPLTPIASAAQYLELKKGDLSGKQLDQLSGTLSRQVTHLTRLVDDLLDLARIERGHITLQEEAVDLRNVASHAVESIPPLQEPDAFDFATALPEDPLIVQGDPIRLTQILANLLDNATKYTPRGGWIRLEAAREGHWIVLRLRDNGAGIDSEFLPRLFEGFARGPDRDTQTMGLGLGLTLTRRLVELHGGTVEAESPGPGEGSTFTVRLPAGDTTREAEAPRTSGQPSVSGQVLLVEDNADVAGSLAFLLESLGQSVRHASTGEEALAIARHTRPTLVLIDIGLPDMNGFEVAARLREILGDTPLVALSGHPASHFPDEPTEAFDDYLLKPPTLESLNKSLERMGLS